MATMASAASVLASPYRCVCTGLPNPQPSSVLVVFVVLALVGTRLACISSCCVALACLTLTRARALTLTLITSTLMLILIVTLTLTLTLTNSDPQPSP